MDDTKTQLQTIQDTSTHPDPKVINVLKKRNLVKTTKISDYKISKGDDFALGNVKVESELTADMVTKWRMEKKGG